VQVEKIGVFLLFVVLGLILPVFFSNFATIKSFSKNLSALIIPILGATFVPNLTLLGLLSPGDIVWKKTHPPRHAAYFANKLTPVVVFEVILSLLRDPSCIKDEKLGVHDCTTEIEMHFLVS